MSSTTETEFHYTADDKRYRGLILRLTDLEAKAAVVLLGQASMMRRGFDDEYR
jgi:hypothetical protein